MVSAPPPDDEREDNRPPGATEGGVPLPEKARPFNFRAELTRRRATGEGDAELRGPAPPGRPAKSPPSLPPGEAPRRIDGDSAEPAERTVIDVRSPAGAPDGPEPPDLPSIGRPGPSPQDGGPADSPASDCCPELETAAVLGLLDTLGARAASLPAPLARSVDEYLGLLRAEAKAISHETALKLAAERSPRVLGQRLQRLAEALVPERLHGGGGAGTPPCLGELTPELRASLERLPGIIHKLRQSALYLLAARLGLETMEPQVGRSIDPLRHSVLESEPGDDPSLDNTVLREEAPGWLLGGEVLAPADVIRTTCPHAVGPGLPDLERLGPRRLGDDVRGRRLEG